MTGSTIQEGETVLESATPGPSRRVPVAQVPLAREHGPIARIAQNLRNSFDPVIEVPFVPGLTPLIGRCGPMRSEARALEPATDSGVATVLDVAAHPTVRSDTHPTNWVNIATRIEFVIGAPRGATARVPAR